MVGVGVRPRCAAPVRHSGGHGGTRARDMPRVRRYGSAVAVGPSRARRHVALCSGRVMWPVCWGRAPFLRAGLLGPCAAAYPVAERRTATTATATTTTTT